MKQEINRLAEFRDKNTEKQFYDSEVKRGLRVSRYTILIFSIINLLFVVTDYLYLSADTEFIIFYSLIPRVFILAMAIFEFFLLKMARNKTAAIKSAIVFAVLMYLIHEYMAMHFAPVDLIFEVLDLVYITFGLFIIPNRWITNICTSAFLTLVFIGFTPWTIPTLASGTKIILTIYLLSQTLIIGTLMFRINKQRRLNYLQKLELEVLAKTDALTNSSNRAACDMTLEQMCSAKCDFSIILIDLDDFKQVNDMYGHVAGDQVIVKTVETIKNGIRQNDIVARWGGEEFIVILPNTARERAVEIAERIKDHIVKLEHDNEIGIVTASFGVTEFIEGDVMKSIINRVDKLLYVGKKQGKNKVFAG